MLIFSIIGGLDILKIYCGPLLSSFLLSSSYVRLKYFLVVSKPKGEMILISLYCVCDCQITHIYLYSKYDAAYTIKHILLDCVYLADARKLLYTEIDMFNLFFNLFSEKLQEKKYVTKCVGGVVLQALLRCRTPL